MGAYSKFIMAGAQVVGFAHLSGDACMGAVFTVGFDGALSAVGCNRSGRCLLVWLASNLPPGFQGWAKSDDQSGPTEISEITGD